MQTKGDWQGVLIIEEGELETIKVGGFQIDPIFHFLVGKRIILNIEVIKEDDETGQGQFSTTGKLERHEKKRVLLLDNYPFVQILKSFENKKVNIKVELDQSVLSSRMY
ncbi:hypothetical protein [Bacillus horti]|uniref:Uncharacterized protein n=1 Tax=Caldalkalibacillus horti TaxID=77523 RepID=A0ABT9W3K9_9BACI|nr:hypothetical protein [Bacillus horti]MDQ0167817.1 hypothetical protein [Bacillus horti]